MPIRLNVAEAKSSRISNVLNIGPNDPRFIQFLNESVQRLLPLGKWIGTYQKYNMCSFSGCITWPRQFETVEMVAICDWPIAVRNEWFEFLENGRGLRKETDECGFQMYDRGIAVSFDDIRGINKKIKVYRDVSEDGSAQILLQGYDENGNWIRTETTPGNWVDGEYVTPSAVGQLTTHIFTSLTGVQKPISNGVWRLYEYDTTLLTQRPLAVYEPDETLPAYRRSLIAGLSNRGSCNGRSSEVCDKKTVTVMAKMAFVPVRVDTDWLLINSIPALRCMAQCLRKEENNLFQEAAEYQARAVNILQSELDAFLGDATIVTLRMPTPSVYGGGVANVI